MNKEQLIEERRKYVKSRVEGVRIARELFLSKATIRKDIRESK
jgi:hypothetical protein